jgi:3'-phosphoadenosine 5'-phosphosulfate sulfotransferase (PAPS reductase)/FAD synthetase
LNPIGPELESYSTVVVAFSGGKDSVACVLHLLECGVPREKIELWHHDVDGREGSKLMDWSVTRDYCRKFAEALGLKLYFSWKVGGFEGEMNRKDAPTGATAFETPEGLRYSGGKGPKNTRGQFPQVSPDLRVRWCSAYLKIDVGAAALRNQERFNNARTLFVTGERAEESSARAKYKTFEPHRTDNRNGRSKRHVDAWRPVHAWKEAQVWEAMARWNINPHPAYRLGWGRVSCAACIFGNPAQWASLRKVAPAQFAQVAGYEAKFGKTIARKGTVEERAGAGTPYPATEDAAAAALATGEEFSEPIILPPGKWVRPAGAFGDGCGPPT